MTKIVVVGGTGLIGSRVVENLSARGHEPLAAARSTGVDLMTGAGLDAALSGAEVVVDVSTSPSAGPEELVEFFRTAGRNLLAAESEAGVRHHVALTIVGAERMTDSPIMRAKVELEQLVEASGVPYTIVRSTQFMEFLRRIADASTDGATVRVSTATLQPIAAADVAAALADVAVSDPLNGTIEIAGPEAISLAELVREVLAADSDPRTVIGDPDALYFGAELTDESLTPGPNVRLATTRFADWLR